MGAHAVASAALMCTISTCYDNKAAVAQIACTCRNLGSLQCIRGLKGWKSLFQNGSLALNPTLSDRAQWMPSLLSTMKANITHYKLGVGRICTWSVLPSHLTRPFPSHNAALPAPISRVRPTTRSPQSPGRLLHISSPLGPMSPLTRRIKTDEESEAASRKPIFWAIREKNVTRA